MVSLADIIAYLLTEEIEEEDEADLGGVEVIVQDDGTVIYPAQEPDDQGAPPPAPDDAAPASDAVDTPAAGASIASGTPAVALYQDRRVRERLIEEVRSPDDPEDVVVTNIGASEGAMPGTLALAEQTGLVTDFQGSVLVCGADSADEAPPESGAVVLLSQRPRLVFALIVDRFFPELHENAPARFHSDRQADQAALAHACVMNAFLGPRVSFGPHATIGCSDTEYERAPDGRHVRVPQRGTVILEGDTEVGAQATVHRPQTGVTRLGQGAKVGPWSEICGGATLGTDALVGADVRIGRGARVGAGAVIEPTSAVADGVTVGDGARVLAGTVITGDVPSGETWGGDPARRVDEAEAQS